MFEIKNGDFLISTDHNKLDLNVILGFLRQSYWGVNIEDEVILKSIENSLCFGLYENENQIGFARVITDYARFAYLADVFILESHRGRGLSRWLMDCIHNAESLRPVLVWMLATRDAHSLYRKYGYDALPEPQKYMIRRVPNVQKIQ